MMVSRKILAWGIITLLVMSALTFTTVLIPEVSEGAGPADSPWPMYQGGPKNSGRSPYDTSHIDGTEVWNFRTNGWVDSSPAIGSDGTIYVGSDDGNLYALNPTGTEKWCFSVEDEVKSSPAVSSDGTIYVGSWNGNLYAVNPNGREKWNFNTGYRVESSPVIGSDGTIYVGSNDHNLYALHSEQTSGEAGTEKWNFSTDNRVRSNPAIGSDGTIYVGSQDDNLYAVNPNGTKKWRFSTGDYILSPAVASDGTIYVGSGDSNLYAVNPDGTEKWNYSIGGWWDVQFSPAIGSDGTIYVSSVDDNLYALHSEQTSGEAGTEKWNFSTSDWVRSSPAIGSDGTVYIGSSDQHLYAVNPDGTEKWNFSTGDEVKSSPAINNDGTIYFGSRDYNLYKVGKDSTPPSASLKQPSEGAGLSSTDVTVEWSGSDGETGINHYEVQIDSSGWTDVGTDTSHTFTGLSDGSHTVDVKAVDGVGNTATDTLNFTVDTISPNVSINSPLDGDNNLGTEVIVNWLGSDITSGIEAYETQLDRGGWMDAGTLTSQTFTDLSNGSHTVDVKAVDNAGNTAIDTVNFTVDAMSPSVLIGSPSGGEKISSTDVSVKWSGSDEESGIDHFEVRLDSSSWTDVEITTNQTFTGLSEGSHTVDVKAVDSAGNSKTNTVNFTVDTDSSSANIFLDSYWWLIIAVTLGVIVAVAIAVKKRKEGPRYEQRRPPQEQQRPPPAQEKEDRPPPQQ